MNSDYEKLGAFYVGREVDAATGQARPEPAAVTLQQVQVAARKSDITVAELAVAWAPWRSGADGFPAPAY